MSNYTDSGMLKLVPFLKKAFTKMRHTTLYSIMRVIAPSIYRNTVDVVRPMTQFCKTYFCNEPVEGVEIGVGFGHNAENILQNLNVKTLWLIDPFEPYFGARGIHHKEYVEGKRRSKWVLRKYRDRGRFLYAKSDDAVKHFEDVSLDFVYVDGCHSYNQVSRDIENYWRLLKSGGILGGHDFCIFYWDVAKAVLDFCENHELLDKLQGKLRYDWWVVKP